MLHTPSITQKVLQVQKNGGLGMTGTLKIRTSVVKLLLETQRSALKTLPFLCKLRN